MNKTQIRMVGRFFGVVLIAAAQLAQAQDLSPPCLARDRQTGREHRLVVNNEHVLRLKKTTPNQTQSRAYVAGTYLHEYSDPSGGGHNHFSIQIGASTQKVDRLEVVFNVEFGRLPRLNPGDQVEACGDYITANAPTEKYRASPDDAIIHWVHENPRGSSGRGHESGFLRINGVVYGHRGINNSRPRSDHDFRSNP